MQEHRVRVDASFVFPDMPDGRAGADSFRAAIDNGDRVIVDGSFIKDIRVSGWLERLYGKRDKPEHIEIISIEAKATPIRLEVESSEYDKPVVIPYIDLNRVKAGQREVTLSNEHQHIPIQLTMVVRDEAPNSIACSFNFRVKGQPFQGHHSCGTIV